MMKNFDIIGFTPQLYVKSQNRYKTNLGGYLTILMAVVSILAILAFGKDMLLKKNPVLYQNDVFDLENQINFSEIPFAISVTKTGGFAIKEISRKVKVTFEYIITNSSNIEKPTNIINYDLVPCPETTLFKNNTLNFKNNLIGDPGNFFCLPDNLNLTWFGQRGNPIFRVGRLNIIPCVNSTNNNNSCLPLNEIQKDLADFSSQYIFVDTYCDLTNFEKPVNYYWKSELIILSVYSTRFDAYSTQFLNIQSDEGIIMETENPLVTHQFESKTALFMNFNSKSFIVLTTGLSNIRTVLGRKYQKIQEVMANVGGFLKFVMLIFCTFNNFVTRFHFIEELYLRSFRKYEEFHKNIRLSDKDKLRDTINSGITNTIYTKNENGNESEKIIHTPSIKISKHNLIIKNLKRRKTGDKNGTVKYKKLNFTSIFCNKKNEVKILKKLNKIFLSQLDIVKLFYMFKKFKLTEKLIFGNLGQKWKNFLVYNNISEIEKHNLTKKKKEKNEFYDGLNEIKTTSRYLDIHKILAVEIDQKILTA